MHKLRLLFVLGFVLILGASFAKGQDGTSVFDDQKPARTTKHDKVSSHDGHRKHWWSPPRLHWFHNKHTAAHKSKAKDTPTSETATAATPATMNAEPESAPIANPTLKAPGSNKILAGKAQATRRASTKTGAARTHTAGKTAASKPMANKPTASKPAASKPTARKGVSRTAQRKRTTGTTAAKKTNDCSPDQAKKGGCAVKASN